MECIPFEKRSTYGKTNFYVCLPEPSLPRRPPRQLKEAESEEATGESEEATRESEETKAQDEEAKAQNKAEGEEAGREPEFGRGKRRRMSARR